ncbi:hypothetical protein [Bradyrhizobium sp. SZCCHNR3003]|uniref:hypothetical protein n=1 Tax=Bradyrhizobium TaxID=374 RepID=UPI002915FF84|nr:hypothetical protein [Bradyrhizobium sp. SZCCHNR3003]
MCCIIFDLASTGGLDTLASPGAGLPGALPRGMGTQGGLYVIVNVPTNNRYIGKAGNLADRFDGRMLTVNEFGLSTNNLRGVGAFWGVAYAFNTPQPPSPPLPVFKVEAGITYNAQTNDGRLANLLLPGQFAPGTPQYAFASALQMNTMETCRVADPIYSLKDPTVYIDSTTVDVEQLLIRFFKMAIGSGGTLTNKQKSLNAFVNSTGNSMIVAVSWGACQALGFPTSGFTIITIANGGAL